LAVRVVCAPDKLRGALDAREAAEALAAGVRDAGGEPVLRPVADGGEGTLDVLVATGVARPEEVRVRDPLGREVTARLGVLDDGAFLVESAEALGHARLSDDERDPLRLSSAGVGDLIAAALDRGATRVVVAIGGTATVDGGLGMLEALGAAVSGRTGAALLGQLSVDVSRARERVREVSVEVLRDVDVPLSGPDGAALLFGPQKGLRSPELELIDDGLRRLGALLPAGVANWPGAGAAGGLGVALYALGASERAGAEAVLDLVGLRDMLAGADLCLTAEGKVDRSSGRGKAVAAIARLCAGAGVDCVVLAGRVEPEGRAALLEAGARDVWPIGRDDARPIDRALAAAARELRAAAAGVVSGAL
jgi:glycerate kinase